MQKGETMFNNQLKTILFISILTGLLLGIGQLIGGKAGLTIALIFAVGFNGLMYFFSHKIVLFMYKAKEADKTKYKELYKASLNPVEKSLSKRSSLVKGKSLDFFLFDFMRLPFFSAAKKSGVS